MNERLFLIGLGLDPIEHVTVESLQALGRCDCVFFQSLDAKAQEYLRRFCADLRPLPREADPSSAAEAVLAELAAGKRVALATPAHPYLWSGLAAALLARAKREELPWKTFGAVSSAGVALAAIGQALGDDILGIQAFDASAIAEGRVSPDPAIPLAAYSYGAMSEPVFESFLRVLGGLYPTDHRVAWCSNDGIERATTVGGLSGTRAELTYQRVLYFDAAVSTSSRWETALDGRRRKRAGGS